MRVLPPYEIADQFFHEFGRFDHELKRNGFLRDRPDAQADWKAFAKALGEAFFEHVTNAGIAKTLIRKPPGKLMKDDLFWKPGQPLEGVVALFEQGVCRVRNNYYHYEKFQANADPEQWERDRVLVSEARSVLQAARAFAVDLKVLPAT